MHYINYSINNFNTVIFTTESPLDSVFCPVSDQNDVDGDRRIDYCDNCIHVFNPSQDDSDHDGVGDACDNCPTLYNPMQLNNDKDITGNLCDQDDDNDGRGMNYVLFELCHNR